jgi:RNA polymerase sigma factor (sigma-70 family)
MTIKSRRKRDEARTREQRFDGLFATHSRAVLAYAVRRTSDQDDAADVLAETFLVAWRRLSDVPSGEGELMWLYGVARRVLANQQRAERRRQRLAQGLGRELSSALRTAAPAAADGHPVLEALAGLDLDDREILLLAAWEELSAQQIGAVLGITQIAARSRLHRARERLQAALGTAARTDGGDNLRTQEAL